MIEKNTKEENDN